MTEEESDDLSFPLDMFFNGEISIKIYERTAVQSTLGKI